MNYLKAAIILIIYVILTRGLFIAMMLFPNVYFALTIQTLSASLFGIGWLYFFQKEHAFKFIQVIKEKKMKTEEKFLNHFLRFGTIIATILIGFVGGPLFCALTAHIILFDYKHRYRLVLLISAISSFVSLALARGVLHLVFRLV